jgi:hypothetical protein
MRTRTTIACIIIGGATWLALSSASVASTDAYKVIVHRDVRVTHVDRDFLRRAFLRITIRWNHGIPVRPIDLPGGSPIRDRFAVEVINKTPSALRSHWLQRIFSGTAVPPPEASNAAEAIEYVRSTPGAVGYIPAAMDPGQTRVVEIR